MATTFTRRINVQHTSGIDPRYVGTSPEHWVVRYIDHDGHPRELVHRGPESVKQRIESMGIPFDSNIDVEFHRK